MPASNPKTSLTPSERQALKGRAHRLNPVVMIAEAGLTASVLAEIERNLAAHELIKIRIFNTDRDVRERLMTEVCAATAAQPVQHIGKILVVYREKPAEAKEESSAPVRIARAPAKRRAAAPARNPFIRAPEGRPGRAPKLASRSASARTRAPKIRGPRER